MQYKRFRRHAFLSGTTRDDVAKRRRLPYVCRNAPEVCRKTGQGGAVSRACTLSASTGSDFLLLRSGRPVFAASDMP